jgi:purine-binding chemotaxis protein CheW
MPDSTIAGAEVAGVRRFLTFRVNGGVYALPAEQVREVIHAPAVARVPRSPPALLGVANLRGAVLPLVGLRELLGAAAKPGDAIAVKAVVLDLGTAVAIAVDSVDSLVAIEESRVEVGEAELGAEGGELLSGAFHTGKRSDVAKILDIGRLLSGAFALHARGAREARSGVHARAPSNEAAMTERAAQMLVTFDVAGQEFALDLSSVQEILAAPAMVMAVPRAEGLVLGVTSLRDRLLPLFSLRGLLGFPLPAVVDGREKVLVVKLGDAQVGLVADRARDVLAARASSIDAVPAVLAARTGGEARIKSIYRSERGGRLVSILEPAQLFREDVMRRLIRDTQDEDLRAAPADAQPEAELTLLIFRLGSDEFGLPIEFVDEVGEVPQKITRLPKTPKFLEGVVNLRGDVLPVVDQRRRFDMPASGELGRRRLVVVRTERHRAGLIVDSVSEVLRVPASSLEPPPDLTEEIGRLVRGVINLERAARIVLVLDPSELLTAAERGRLDAFQKASRADA